MKRIYFAGAFALILGFTYVATISYSQQGDPSIPEAFVKRSLDSEKSGLAEAFRGVTTDGNVVPGLFSIKSTGVSTGPMRKAAQEFLQALSPEQRKKTLFPVDDIEWRKWMNQDFYVRQGVGFIDMNDAQKEKAFGMMKASALSSTTLKSPKNISKRPRSIARS